MSHSKRKREQIERLRSRDGDKCHLCGEFMLFDLNKRTHPRAATLDHLTPRHNGGSSYLGNLALAHRQCNEIRRHWPVDVARRWIRMLKLYSRNGKESERTMEAYEERINDAMGDAFDYIVTLEQGSGLLCDAITDKHQKTILMRARRCIERAMILSRREDIGDASEEHF